MGGDYESSNTHKTLKCIQDIGNYSESIGNSAKSFKGSIEDLACHNYARQYAANGGDYETGYKMKQEEIQEYHEKHKY